MTLLLLLGGAGAIPYVPSGVPLPALLGISRNQLPTLVGGGVTYAWDRRKVMTAVNQKMELWSGDDVVQPVQLVDEHGAPENLANFTRFEFTVRDKPKGTIIVGPLVWTTAVPGTSIAPQTNGLVNVLIGSTATASAPVGGSKVTWYQELEGTKTGGNIRTLEEGPFILHQSIAGAGSA
jgi:hypothetical protein